MRARSILALLSALALSGCLLPQPDTPIIPPAVPGSGPLVGSPARTPVERAQPAESAPAPEAQTALAPMPAGDAESATRAMSLPLKGTITGAPVASVTAVPFDEAQPKREAEVKDGAFELALTDGSYWLDFRLASGRVRRLASPVSLAAGVGRELRIELSEEQATLIEVVSLVDQPTGEDAPVEEPVATP